MEDALRRAYFNVDTGFASIAKTYKAAKALDARVTMAATREFLAKQEGRQKANRRTDNSYVARGPRETVQVDLADFQGFGPPSEFRYAFIGVDVFTKLAFAKPVKGKTPDETAAAMEEALKTYGLVKNCYTDLGGEFTNAFSEVLRKHLANHITSRTPPAFVERLIRTLKSGVRERQGALPNTPWWRLLEPVVKQYNEETHTTTEVTPKAAAKLTWEKDEDDIVEIRGTLQDKAHSNRTYPTISVGDRVKLFRKPGKFGEMKEGFNHWTTRTYEVTKTWMEDGVAVFSLEGHGRSVRNHEILKVGAVEKPTQTRRRQAEGDRSPCRSTSTPSTSRWEAESKSPYAPSRWKRSCVAAPR